ncbi:hypothetical protein [Priestia megaterium]|uniref:phage scaffolding protein n=1 Tax=Priestia megaterium TaxID=1404 RepID=UPI0039F64D0B
MSEEIKNEQVEVEQTETHVEQQTETKTFTQAELDEIVEKRIQRERKKLDKYSDYDDKVAKADAYEKLLEEKRLAELSEKERLEEIAKKHEEEKQSLAQQLDSLRKQAEQEKIVNAFIKAAPGVNIPTDRIDAALKLADLSAVQIEDGTVNGVEDVLTTLVDQYSFLVGEEKKPQREIGEPSNNGTSDEAKTLEAQLEDAKKKKDFAKVIELSNKIQSLFK